MYATRGGRNIGAGIVLLSVATVAVALLFWNSPLLLPVKLFVVLLHEISHGMAALLTGGRVEQLVLLQDEGGLAFTRAGNRFLILSAGYLGSALWGILFMRLAWAAPATRRLAVRLVGLALLLVTLLYVRSLFTLIYVAGVTLLLIALGWRGSAAVQRAALWLFGSFSCLYAVIDIGTDILLRGPLAGVPFLGGTTGFSNDAELLASITLIPSFVWGLLWSVLALALYVSAVYSLAMRR
ncbi:MAG: M50 family metallopeptidase [Ardenticatenaceae bacterium]